MTIEEWAVAREKELRDRAYLDAMLWERAVDEALALFACADPEGQWVRDMEAQFSLKVSDGDA